MIYKFSRNNAEYHAKHLLGCILVRQINKKKLKSIIVETEAYYGNQDPASRACQNGKICQTMKRVAGTILVYGIHNNWMFNIVTGKKDVPQGVLIRALQPLNYTARTNGPGLLTKALKIDKSFNNKKLNKFLYIITSKMRYKIATSKRIGVTKDLSKHMRYYIQNNKWVSK